MQVQINLTLPCSPDDWNKLTQIQAICSLGSTSLGEISELPFKLGKKLSAPTVDDKPMVEDLSENEKKVLDAAFVEATEKGTSPVLDRLAIEGASGKKPSLRMLMEWYMKEHNGHATLNELYDFVKSKRPELKNIKGGLQIEAWNLGYKKNNGHWYLPGNEPSHQSTVENE